MGVGMSTKIQLTYDNRHWTAFLPELKDSNGDVLLYGSGSDPAGALFDCLQEAGRVLLHWQDKMESSQTDMDARIEAVRNEGHDQGWMDCEQFYKTGPKS